MALTGKYTREKGQKGVVGRSAHQYEKCVAYWHQFLGDCAPRPNKDTRLFPSALNLRLQYRTHFLDYATKQKWEGAAVPSFSTWERARHDPLFDDVKVQKKHFHTRCDACSSFRTALENQWGKTDIRQLRLRYDAHLDNIHDWRLIEKHWFQRCHHSPTDCAVLVYDDTECVELPHFGRNPPKGWGPRKKKLKVCSSATLIA